MKLLANIFRSKVSQTQIGFVNCSRASYNSLRASPQGLMGLGRHRTLTTVTVVEQRTQEAVRWHFFY